MVLILVIVNPGCDTQSQADLERQAWILLTEHAQNTDPKGPEMAGSHNHHVFGRSWHRGEFEFCRGLCHSFEDGNLPTIHPISHGALSASAAICLGCDGTGLIPFASAVNVCPLCGGNRVQVDDDLTPGIFPMALLNPEFMPSAIITPDGCWHSPDKADGWWGPDWASHVHLVGHSFRHCYGVCMRAKY